MKKNRFMSPGWIQMAREEITNVLALKYPAGIDFTLCEEFTAPPDELRRANAAPARTSGASA